MIIKELKKKNYFRYLQLQLSNYDKKDEIALIFLFEIELYKIYNSTLEPILKKIKYQWLIDEIHKEKSNYFLVKNLHLRLDKLNITSHLIEIINNFQFLDEKIEDKKLVDKFFKEFNSQFNFLIKRIYFSKKDEFFSSYEFQVVLFFYTIKKYDYFFEKSYFINLNVENIFEKTFINLFFNKKRYIHKPITKLSFLINLIKNSF